MVDTETFRRACRPQHDRGKAFFVGVGRLQRRFGGSHLGHAIFGKTLALPARRMNYHVAFVRQSAFWIEES